MQPAAGTPRPGPAAAAATATKKKKKMKKTKKIVKQVQPRAEAAAAAAERAAAEQQAAEEAARRARHLKALSRTSGAERELEELVFGDSLNVEEDELLQRLAGPRRVGLGARRAGLAPRPFLRPGPRRRGARGGGAFCGPEQGLVLAWAPCPCMFPAAVSVISLHRSVAGLKRHVWLLSASCFGEEKSPERLQ